MAKRKLRRGYITKQNFCKEYGIKYKDFDKRLIESGLLYRNHISTCLFSGKKKFALSIKTTNQLNVIPLNGSWKQGTYQYKKKFIEEMFGF
jgi:hypothetical protein